jgi:PAS domain S-box-containing protein
MRYAPRSRGKEHARCAANISPVVERQGEDFRAVADALPQVVWSLDSHGRLAWVNRQFAQYTGCDTPPADAADAVGWAAVVHADDLSGLVAAWLTATTRGDGYSFEYRLRAKAGAYRWFLAQVTPYRDAEGAIVGWLAISSDVDAIKRADEQVRAILEAMPESMWVADTRGQCMRVNKKFCAYSGLPAEHLEGVGWQRMIHPEDWPIFDAAGEEGERTEDVIEWTFRLRRHDGVFRSHLCRAAPVREAAGAIIYWVVTCTDVDDQARARAELQLLADTIPQFVCILGPTAELQYANEQFRAYSGAPVGPARTRWAEIVHPEDFDRARAFWRHLDPAAATSEIELRLRRIDGSFRWFLIRLSGRIGDARDVSAWYTTAVDIDDRKRSADALTFLVQSGEALSAPRDVRVALERAAALAVPGVADWCAVYLREPDGYFRPATIHHADPAKVELAKEMVRRYPFSVESAARMMETREPVFMPLISAAALRAGAVDASHAALLDALDIASAIVVPLVVDDAVTGTVHLVRGHGRPGFVGTDVDLAQILAKRIAIAIDNAVVYERERNVAQTFQNAALPRTLPRIEGLCLHSCYVAGERGAEIGGDWYDAFTLRDGSLLFSIGDVAGKGLDAAVLMASMRNAIRVAGLQGLEPADVVHAANALLTLEQPGRFVTAFVGRMNAARTHLSYASAGHAPPLLRDARSVRSLALGEPPLGVWERPFTPHSIELSAPWLLVAYTDGLIERTGDVIAGEQLLRDVVQINGITHAADPARFLQHRLIRGVVRDDTAILTLRVDGCAHWRFGASDALAAEPARRRLRAWLERETTGDFAAAELIYGELIGNVVRHAPGPIDIDVALGDDGVRLVVQSSGPKVTDRPALPVSPLREGGRGLFIVDALGTGYTTQALPIFGNQTSVDLPLTTIRHAARRA